MRRTIIAMFDVAILFPSRRILQPEVTATGDATTTESQSSFHRGAFFNRASAPAAMPRKTGRNPLSIEAHSSTIDQFDVTARWREVAILFPSRRILQRSTAAVCTQATHTRRNPLSIEAHSSTGRRIRRRRLRRSQSSFHRGAFFNPLIGVRSVTYLDGRNPLSIEAHSSTLIFDSQWGVQRTTSQSSFHRGAFFNHPTRNLVG